MKSNKIRAFALLFAAFALCSLAFGQATMQSTTLSAAIDDSQKSFAVAAVTSVKAPGVADSQGSIGAPSTNNYYILYVDREAMKVDAVSGTTVTVHRGFQGTRQTKHASGEKVWTGPANYYGMQDAGAGSIEPVSGTPCTSANLKVLPFVAVSTGRIWTCGNSLWSSFDPSVLPTVGATLDLSSSGATITPTNPVHSVSGASTAFNTITVPAALPLNGCLRLLPTATWHTTTGGNVLPTSYVAVVGQTVEACYIGSSWYLH